MQLQEVIESVKFINEKFEKYKADWKQKEQEIAELKEDLAPLKESLSKLTKPYIVKNSV